MRIALEITGLLGLITVTYFMLQYKSKYDTANANVDILSGAIRASGNELPALRVRLSTNFM